VKEGNWTRDEILITFRLYVEIRDDGRDDKAPVKDLAKLLDRDVSAVRAAVMAPSKVDPLWKGKRHYGLSDAASALWEEYSGDLPRLRKQARELERRLRLLKPPRKR